MELNLIQFNEYMKTIERKPPVNSDSFYTIQNGDVSLFCIEEDKYEITVRSGTIFTGAGNCYISKGNESLFKQLTVIPESTLNVIQGFTIIDSNVTIQGNVILNHHSRMYIRGNSKVRFTESSSIDVDDNSDIIVEKSADVLISGEVKIGIRRLESFTEKINIKFESSSVILIKDLNESGSNYTLNAYRSELSKLHITPNSINEKVYNHGENILGYKWVSGTYEKRHQILDLYTYKGIAILGSLKILFKGIPNDILPNTTGLRNLYIGKKTELHIVEKFGDQTYVRSKLYIGAYTNGKSPAECHVSGKVLCKGEGSSIILDKNGRFYIEETAEVKIAEGATFWCDPSCTEKILYIDGTLIIDYIEQIETFRAQNISFGEKGKIIILNPSKEERRYLFSTPNQIKTTSLYKILLKDYLKHIEYHVNKNTGIRIDQYYEFYGRDMKEWFGNKRIEQCIKEKIIVWDNGFIELDRKVIPWVSVRSSLIEVSRIFKCFGSFEVDKLQDMVNRLLYAGSGNIVFRFISDTIEKELILNLEHIRLKNVYYDSIQKKFVVKTDNDGLAFLRNNSYDEKLILSDESKKEIVHNHTAMFEL